MKDNKYSYNLLEAFEDLNREGTLKETLGETKESTKTMGIKTQNGRKKKRK